LNEAAIFRQHNAEKKLFAKTISDLKLANLSAATTDSHVFKSTTFEAAAAVVVAFENKCSTVVKLNLFSSKYVNDVFPK